jgi:hypothetical protein
MPKDLEEIIKKDSAKTIPKALPRGSTTASALTKPTVGVKAEPGKTYKPYTPLIRKQSSFSEKVAAKAADDTSNTEKKKESKPFTFNAAASEFTFSPAASEFNPGEMSQPEMPEDMAAYPYAYYPHYGYQVLSSNKPANAHVQPVWISAACCAVCVCWTAAASAAHDGTAWAAHVQAAWV